MSSSIVLRLLRSVKSRNIKKYLCGKGWSECAEFPRKDVWLFNHSTSGEQVIISKDDSYELYPNDLLSVINVLQHIEQRDMGLIITQLQRPNVDIVRYRIQSPQIESGTLPLNVVNKFIVSVVNSFKAAISDCISPNLHHPRMGGTRLDQLLEQSQFGQTEHGSYVVRIIAPVLQEEQFGLLPPADNDIRKGVVHLLKSTNEIVQAVKDEKAEQFVQDNIQHLTVSDNFVNALVDMQLSDDTSLEIISDWSPMLPIPSVPSRVIIDSEYFSGVSAIGCRLSPKPEDSAAELFTGFVTQLDGNPNDNGKPEGDVRIDILTPDQGSFAIIAELNQDDYQTAISAHSDTIPVFFSGKLIRKSARRREIVAINNFKLSPTK